jgi:hypothetical protein
VIVHQVMKKYPHPSNIHDETSKGGKKIQTAVFNAQFLDEKSVIKVIVS